MRELLLVAFTCQFAQALQEKCPHSNRLWSIRRIEVFSTRSLYIYTRIELSYKYLHILPASYGRLALVGRDIMHLAPIGVTWGMRIGFVFRHAEGKYADDTVIIERRNQPADAAFRVGTGA